MEHGDFVCACDIDSCCCRPMVCFVFRQAVGLEAILEQGCSRREILGQEKRADGAVDVAVESDPKDMNWCQTKE